MNARHAGQEGLPTQAPWRRRLKAAALAIASAVVLGSSGIAWYGFAQPPVHVLPLPATLIAVASPEGERLLAGAAAQTDYRQLLPYFVSQSRRAFCGAATGSMIVNAELHPTAPVTQAGFFGTDLNALRTNLAVTMHGMTLDELAQFLRARGLRVTVVHANGSSLESFRDLARAALSEPEEVLVVNYDRRQLGQEGGGHISPIGAYNRDADRLLVMDVAAYRYPFTWVTVRDLWVAMNTVDTDSGRTRGFLLVRRNGTSDTGRRETPGR